MEKRRIITISGRPGSGKSTTSKAVASALGFEQFSSGSLFRQLAGERGLDLLTANLTAEQNSEIDNLVDGRLREINTTGDKLVIDSRTAWHWMPASFKVYLDLALTLAAERIIASTDKSRLASERIPGNPTKYATVLESRLASEMRRYKALYDINPYDTSNYDLVIDTAVNGIDESVELVVEAFQAWLAG